MQTPVNYAAIAAARDQELGARIGIGFFIAASAYFLAPSPWVVVWLCGMIFIQLCDRNVSAALGEQGDDPPWWLKAAYIASALTSSIAYTAITPYIWLNGGDPGHWFALILSCGGMLHVALRSFSSPRLLIAAGAPHAAMLFTLPILHDATGAGVDVRSVIIVLLGGCIYVAHLVAAVRQSQGSMTLLSRASDEAHAAQRLAESASAAKSEFLATVSHEIRTPMNAVLSAAHLLKRTSLTREQDEHVAMLTNAGEVLVGLLNDVLDISKIEAGKMVLDEADLDLAEAMDSLIKLYAPRLESKGVALVLDMAPDVPRMIRTDPLRVRQILFNLLSNAAKFTESGQVTIRGRVERAGEAEVLTFEVEDTGIGIDEEAQGRLFGSFEQARGDTARSHGGTGLGLAISRKLAEMMGGGLTCTSIIGRGSTFRLETPLIRSEASAGSSRKSAADEADDLPVLSILVAEDHDVNRKIVGLFLEPLGWRLTMAVNGAEAVQAADREPFDAILMDMQMPVLGGVDASLAIRQGDGPNANTPIIALTANALGHHRDAWDAVGVAAFLTKPIDPDLLVSTLLAAYEATAAEPAAAAA
jgi:signal transduction histidine kinase/CheY-like chemotaxis protein